MAVITWLTYSSYVDKYNNNKNAVIGVSVYCVIIAFLMLIVETPVLNCFGAIKRAKEHWMLSPSAKAIYYFCLSILTFVYITPNIGSGAMLVLTSVFELMAQCQKSQDAADQAKVTGKSSIKTPLSNSV